MKILSSIFENNRKWVSRITGADPFFFCRLARQQAPEYLWIGCSDSRVPASLITGLLPGEIFVHRNIANIVNPMDMNCLSVLQYAVDVLKVKHIIVCGHYGCGGVRAAMEGGSPGVVDDWLRPVSDICQKQRAALFGIRTAEERVNRLCELNVAEQVKNIGNTSIVYEAWARGRDLTIHGWIYAVGDGMLKDLEVCIASAADIRRLETV